MIRVIASYTKSVTPLLVLPEITKGQETHRTCRQPCNAIFLGVSSRYRYGGWFKNPEKSSAFLEPPVCFFYPMNGLVQKQAKRLAHSIHWFIITIPIKIAISKLENAHSFICCPHTCAGKLATPGARFRVTILRVTKQFLTDLGVERWKLSNVRCIPLTHPNPISQLCPSEKVSTFLCDFFFSAQLHMLHLQIFHNTLSKIVTLVMKPSRIITIPQISIHEHQPFSCFMSPPDLDWN